MRPDGRFANTLTRDQLYRKLYVEGVTPQNAAIHFNVSWEKVRRLMMEYGLTYREVAVQLAQEKERATV